MNKVSRYHPALVLLHWLLAFFVISALILGATIMAHTANSDPAKIEMLQKHMGGGIAILVLMLVRLVLRNATDRPPRASAGHPWLDRLAALSHRLFYVAVFGQAASGALMALQTGLPDIVYAHHGTLPADFWVLPMRSVHYAVSRLLMALIALHVAGALYHTFVVKDRLLRRMGFGRRAAARPSPLPHRSPEVHQ